MSRTHQLTPEAHTTIVTSLKMGSTRRAAAQNAGISPRTLRHWVQIGKLDGAEEQYVRLSLEVERAEAGIELSVTSSLLKAARGTEDKTDEDGNVIRPGRPGDFRAAAFWLERRRPEYRQKQVNIDGELERLLNVVEQICGEDVADEVFAAFERGDSESSGE